MIVGIDLGTTNSLIAYCKDGKVEVIPNRLGKLLTPSVVAVDENENILVGDTAKEFGYLYPDRCAKVFKRTMGTNKKYDLGDKSFLSEELSSFVLRSLIEDAEVFLNEKIEEAIISVPAYFDDNQRKATKKAGELIGLNVSRIINEPTASAIAYGIGNNDINERCLVFDLGGGTFDVSILEYYKSIMEVCAIAGDNNLGGEDFTMVLMQLFLEKIGLADCIFDIYTINALYKMSEKAKCEFSSSNEVTMKIDINGGKYHETIDVNEYERACLPLLERISKPIEKSLRDAKATLDDIDRVILVGGATKLPIVRKFVQNVLNNYTPSYYVDPETSVAVGAALQAAMKDRQKEIKEIVLTDVCPFTLGTEVVDHNSVFDGPGLYLPIIERNTIIPVSKKQTLCTAHENQKYVTVKVLQGESRLARNNLFLGDLTVEVPVGPKGQEAIDVTYTYDVNSLLEVEVTVLSTKETKKMIIQNDNNISEEEAKKRFEELQFLKQNPRDEEENLYAILRGNRVFEEVLGEDKRNLEKELENFDRVLSKGTRIEIDRARKKLLELLDSLENKDVNIYLS